MPTLSSSIVDFAETLYTVDRAWVPRDGRWVSERNHAMVLQPWQREALLDVFPIDGGGRPVWRNALWSANKKMGKSAIAGLVGAYLAATEPGGEVYVCAADQDQARDRVFKSMAYAVEHGPLGDFATVKRDRIDFTNGAEVQAFPMDFKGAAGGQPVCTIFDELHTYTLESNRRLWDEMVTPPTLPYGIRWVSSYAGYVGESTLLQECWQAVTAGEQVRAWPPTYHNGPAGWWGLIVQGERGYDLVPWTMGERGREYLQQARDSERPNAYARLFLNEWVSAESTFIEPGAWDALIDADYAVPDRLRSDLRLVVGLDLATRHDSAAAVSVYHHAGRLNLGPYAIWRPTPTVSLDAVEQWILELKRCYPVERVVCDPYQAELLMERLRRAGVRAEGYPQTIPNMTRAGNGLFTAIKEARLRVYAGAKDLRAHVLNAVAKETPEGIRLTKGGNTSRKIDAAIALAMAVVAAGAVERRPMVAGTFAR